MIKYITLGTNDLAAARAFYNSVMASLGYSLRAEYEDELGYGPLEPENILLWVTKPYDGRNATVGNGSMTALRAASRQAVDNFHAAGLAAGGTDEGAPGLRPYGPNFYACYLRDPDGNKLSAVCDSPE